LEISDLGKLLKARIFVCQSQNSTLKSIKSSLSINFTCSKYDV
jgi:hypothetical protein